MSILDRLRSRFVPPLLVAGAAGAVFLLMPDIPHEHRVDLRLDDAATVTGVELAWAPSQTPHADAVQGGSWRFAAGKAPAKVDARVNVPNGKYALDVVVERGTEREAFHRVITLGDADHITVPLR